jgi:hypothetical protein
MNLMLSVAEQLAYGVDRRRTMAELRAAKEERTERANRAKREFLAGMSTRSARRSTPWWVWPTCLLGSRLDAEQRDHLREHPGGGPPSAGRGRGHP